MIALASVLILVFKISKVFDFSYPKSTVNDIFWNFFNQKCIITIVSLNQNLHFKFLMMIITKTKICFTGTIALANCTGLTKTEYKHSYKINFIILICKYGRQLNVLIGEFIHNDHTNIIWTHQKYTLNSRKLPLNP